MKVRLLLELDDRDRYVIAKYFGSRLPRATREQARKFAKGALRDAVREQAEAFRGRQRAAAKRLEEAQPVRHEPGLRQPAERQLSLLTGVS